MYALMTTDSIDLAGHFRELWKQPRAQRLTLTQAIRLSRGELSRFIESYLESWFQQKHVLITQVRYVCPRKKMPRILVSKGTRRRRTKSYLSLHSIGWAAEGRARAGKCTIPQINCSAYSSLTVQWDKQNRCRESDYQSIRRSQKW
jgi:hypothetical protein